MSSTNERGRKAAPPTDSGAKKAQRGGAIRHLKENPMAAKQTIINRSKQIIIGVSNKGGVGKTALMKAIAELHRQGLPKLGVAPAEDTLLIDGDTGVKGLSSIFSLTDEDGQYNHAKNKAAWRKGCLLINFHDKEDIERIAGAMRMGAKTIIVDCPGNVTDFAAVFGDIDGFKGQCAKYEYAIKVIALVSYDEASAMGASLAAQAWGEGVEFIAVRNLGHAKKDEFLFFDGEFPEIVGNPREEIESRGGRVVDMPALDPATLQTLAAMRGTIQDVIAKIDHLVQAKQITDDRIEVRSARLDKFLHKDCIPMFFDLGLLVDEVVAQEVAAA